MIKFEAVRLKDDSLFNGIDGYMLDDNRILYHNRTYLILGGVSDTGHIILLDYSTGLILPGMWHNESFRPATDDEL